MCWQILGLDSLCQSMLSVNISDMCFWSHQWRYHKLECDESTGNLGDKSGQYPRCFFVSPHLYQFVGLLTGWDKKGCVPQLDPVRLFMDFPAGNRAMPITVNDHYNHAQFTGTNNRLFVCVNMIIHHNRPQRSYTYILESSDPALLQPLSKRHKNQPLELISGLERDLCPLHVLGMEMKRTRNLLFKHWRNGLGERLAEAFVLEACCFPNVVFPSSAPSKVDMSAHGARLQNTFTAWTWLDSFIYFKSDVWQTIFVKSTQSSVLLNRSLPP